MQVWEVNIITSREVASATVRNPRLFRKNTRRGFSILGFQACIQRQLTAISCCQTLIWYDPRAQRGQNGVFPSLLAHYTLYTVIQTLQTSRQSRLSPVSTTMRVHKRGNTKLPFGLCFRSFHNEQSATHTPHKTSEFLPRQNKYNTLSLKQLARGRKQARPQQNTHL